MKHLSKFFACSAVALLFASCSSPLQKAMSAVEKEDYTTAATQLSKLTIEDINNMDYLTNVMFSPFTMKLIGTAPTKIRQSLIKALTLKKLNAKNLHFIS